MSDFTRHLRTSLNGNTLTISARLTLNDLPLFMGIMADFEAILLAVESPSSPTGATALSQEGGAAASNESPEASGRVSGHPREPTREDRK